MNLIGGNELKEQKNDREGRRQKGEENRETKWRGRERYNKKEDKEGWETGRQNREGGRQAGTEATSQTGRQGRDNSL